MTTPRTTTKHGRNELVAADVEIDDVGGFFTGTTTEAGLPIVGVGLDKSISWEEGHPIGDEETTANTILANINVEEILDIDAEDFRSKYQAALIRLDQIINSSNPTQAQIVAGMQDMARYQRAMMKLLYRIYR